MRFLITVALALACADSARADRLKFANVVKASLEFRDDFDATRRYYPHVLKVFLRLDNVHDGEVTWVASNVACIKAELLDADGKPVPRPPFASSIQYNLRPFNLPYGSRLDWLISHGGISMAADSTNKYALMIGGQGWLIPKESASSCSLRIRLFGRPWSSHVPRDEWGQLELLLDLPPTKLEIGKDD
jgi:hypothetical protein